jgi:DNA (cytosine-5)-methyltransferase 1
MIRVIEFFSGIGSQTQALKNQKINHEVVGTSDWSINSVISYGEIHAQVPIEIPSRNECLEYLKKWTFSLDTKKPFKLERLSTEKLSLLYKNHINSKNLGSIVDINGADLPQCDLLTYSFPCQDISNQGKQKGLYDGNSSSLLWQVGRILEGVKSLPSILLMENVSAILNEKHSSGLEKWKLFLENLGYQNYIFKLKASYLGLPQNRERCFMVSSLVEMPNLVERITSGLVLTDKRIKDIIEYDVDKKYNLDTLTRMMPPNFNPNATKNGIESIIVSEYSKFISEAKVYSLTSISPTVTATGANSRIKIYQDSKVRKLTPKETWRLMGFSDNEFSCVSNIHSDVELVKQAGNSIPVPVLEHIFKNIYKKN